MSNNLLKIQGATNAIAVLIDPDKSDNGPTLLATLQKAEIAKIDFIFIGGSTVTRASFQETATFIKNNSSLPLIIFPGSSQQISEKADSLLYLSLLSGRNPDFLIGHHVESALELSKMDIEIIPTGYLLIDGGTKSSVAYVSQTQPIPRENSSIVKRTAIAGKFQGKKLLFLDAGSGAQFPVPIKIVEAIKDLDIPLIIGGGIKTIAQIEGLHHAGASVVVIGNKIEEDEDFLLEIAGYKKVKRVLS